MVNGARTPTFQGRMDQRIRMIGVLGCLVTAMTCTAALLNWLDPAGQANSPTLSESQIDQQVWQAVADIDAAPRQDWQRVVVEFDQSGSQRTTLAAVADRLPCHFRLERSGQLRVNRQWAAQESIATAPDAIHVVAVAGRDAQTLTPAQQTCVQLLAAAVSNRIGNAPSPLPIAGLVPAS